MESKLASEIVSLAKTVLSHFFVLHFIAISLPPFTHVVLPSTSHFGLLFQRNTSSMQCHFCSKALKLKPNTTPFLDLVLLPQARDTRVAKACLPQPQPILGPVIFLKRRTDPVTPCYLKYFNGSLWPTVKSLCFLVFKALYDLCPSASPTSSPCLPTTL